MVSKIKGVFTVLSTSRFISSKTLGLIRHILTTVGGILILSGVTSAEQASDITDKLITIATSFDSILGEFLIAVGTISSWFAKEKQ